MTETMLERMARAAYEEMVRQKTGWMIGSSEYKDYCEEVGYVPYSWPETGFSASADSFRLCAKAALKAIREPSQELIDASSMGVSDLECFRKAIDAILSGDA